jgi:hypothetical protein
MLKFFRQMQKEKQALCRFSALWLHKSLRYKPAWPRYVTKKLEHRVQSRVVAMARPRSMVAIFDSCAVWLWKAG